MINPRDINAGKVDRCLVADCPEHWRCLDIEHPERCEVYRMMTRDKARKIEREREREIPFRRAIVGGGINGGEGAAARCADEPSI